MLLVVDVQRDFCPGGALAVKDGDKVVPILNRTIEAFEKSGLPVFFSRDWHPPNHISFRSQGGVWPPHCVQETKGAEFHPGLRIPPGSPIISKGDRPLAEAYSAFQGTGLGLRLKKMGVDELFIGGLTTEYCVRESSLDALHAGFKVSLLEDGIRAIDDKPGDGAKAVADMRKAGAKLTTSSSVDKLLANARRSHHLDKNRRESSRSRRARTLNLR